MDAIAEVNVQMSAYTPEYGLKGGSQINFIIKRRQRITARRTRTFVTMRSTR